MHPDVGTALHLQELDRTIAELRQEIAYLPKQIAQIEKALDAHLKKLELDKGVLAGNQRERKRFEVEVQGHRDKISKLKDQMLGAKNNEQYRAFQKEIEWCEAEIRKCDEQALVLMEEADRLAKNVAAAELSLAGEKKVVDSRKKEAQHQTERDKAELTRFAAERAKLAATLAKPLLVTYERLQKRMPDAKAIAKVEEGACSACNMNIRPQRMADLRIGIELHVCENCRRILYLAPPSTDVAAEMNV